MAMTEKNDVSETGVNYRHQNGSISHLATESDMLNPLTNGHAKNGINGHVQHNGTNGYHNYDSHEQKQHSQKYRTSKESFEEVPLITACLTYLGFYVLMVIGYVNQLFVRPNLESEKHRDGYVPLYNSFERFYMAYVYRRIRDCWNQRNDKAAARRSPD